MKDKIKPPSTWESTSLIEKIAIIASMVSIAIVAYHLFIPFEQ